MMAESTASSESQHHSPIPVARPRRNRSKSAIQSSSSEQGSHDRSLQENTKPERPSVPPRPNFNKLKKLATRTHTVHSQASPSNAKQRQISTENHAKSPGSPRLVGSNSANTLRAHQRKSEQLQRIRSKSSSECVDSGHSNGTLKQHQNLCNKVSADSGLQGSRSTKPSSAVRVSHSQSFSSPEHKRGTNTITSTGRANTQQQSPILRPKPPLPANRPSIAPSTASSKGSPTRQNQRPSRPPTLPKTAATLNTSKTSHLYGSTQSLPAITEGSRKVANTPKYYDDSSESTKVNGSLATAAESGCRLKVSPNKGPQRLYRTLPKDCGRKGTTQESPLRSQNRTSDTPHAQGRRATPSSTNVGTTTAKHLSGSKDQNNRPTTFPRKMQPQQSKIPPKRPPPVVRDKPHPAVVTKAPHTLPSVDDSIRYTTFTNQVQQWQQQHPIDDHIYMEVGQMPSQQTNSVSNWPTEGGSEGPEYPYVIMSRTDSVHIYTPLALDTTDDAEDYDIVVPGSDLQESLTISVTECSELNSNVKDSASDEDIHQYENRASLTNTVPQPESPVFNDECLRDDNGLQTGNKEDIPVTECVMIAEDYENSHLADQHKEPEDVSGQEQDTEGTCSSQSAPQLECQDSQQSAATQLKYQDSEQSATHLECQDSQQLAEQLERDLECHQVGEESGGAAQEVAMEEEEIQKSQSDQELNQEVNEENRETVEDHTAHSEGYQEPPRAVSLKVRMESVEETETKEECEQQSRSDQPLNNDVLTETARQPENSACTDADTREVMDPTTPTQLQARAPDSPVDQELPDYCNVDAINMHMDSFVTV